MVERQPRDHAVLDGDAGRLGHKVDGRHDVLVAEHDAPRMAGAARRVLQERQIVFGRRGHRGEGCIDVEVGRLQHVGHVWRELSTLVHAHAEPADGRDRHRVGVAEDVGRRVHAERGVERDRHRADPQGAEERVEELRARRVDEADLVARAHTRPREPGRVARALRPQPPVRHGLVEEPKVLPIRRARHAPPHHLREG